MATVARFAVDMVGNLGQYQAAMEQGVQIAQASASRITLAFSTSAARVGAAFTAVGRSISRTVGGIAGLNQAFASFGTTASGTAALMSVFMRQNEEARERLEALSLSLIAASAAARILGGALRFAVTPLGAVVTAIGTAVVALFNWESTSRLVADATARIWGTVGEFFRRFWTAIRMGFEGLGNILRGWLTLNQTLRDQGASMLETAGEKLVAVVEDARAGITSRLEEIWAGFFKLGAAAETARASLKGLDEFDVGLFSSEAELAAARMTNFRLTLEREAAAIRALTQSLDRDVAPLAGFEVGLFSTGLELQAAAADNAVRTVMASLAEFDRRLQADVAALGDWAEAVGEATTAVQTLVDPLIDLEKQLILIDAQVSVFGRAFDGLGARIQATQGAIVALLEQGVSPTSVRVQELAARLRELEGIRGVQDVVRDVFGSLDTALSRSVAGVQQGTLSISQAFADMGQSILLSLQELVIRRGLRAVEEALIDFVATAFRLGLGGALGLSGGVGLSAAQVGALGGASMVSAVPMQHGGLVRRPTLVVAGEAGPEAIVPLHQMATLGTQIVFENHAPNTTIRPAGTTRGPDGREIQRFVIELIRTGIEGGMIDRVMARRFGMSPRI